MILRRDIITIKMTSIVCLALKVTQESFQHKVLYQLLSDYGNHTPPLASTVSAPAINNVRVVDKLFCAYAHLLTVYT